MLIAQISDLHIMPEGGLAWGRYDTAMHLARCVSDIMRMRPLPDVVLATGDLVDGGTEAEYRRLRELLVPLAVPVYLIPGNHDTREALCAVFGDHAYLPRDGQGLYYVVEGGDLRLVALDTVIAGESGGALGEEQLQWLESVLAAAPRRPTLLFMHHPPVATGMACMDHIILDATDARRLGDIVIRHPQVQRIICGHVHRGMQLCWCGTLVSVCPGTAYQSVLALDGGAFAPSLSDPPAFQLHHWNGQNLVTHTLSVTQHC